MQAPHSVTLQPQGIAQLLRDYPNPQFVETLVSIASSGAHIGYEGSLHRTVQQPNHSSSLMNSGAITAAIESEVKKGRIKEVTSLPHHYFCSPIGVVPKLSDGVQTGWRTIFDLSAPRGRSVNDAIPQTYGSITYETTQDAIRLVAQAGRGAIMMKRDLKSAFRHIPICASDHWLMLFEWLGRYYVDMFLPFGLRTAPRIFNLFSEALHWVFETLRGWNLTHYLDDFLIVFPPDTDITAYSRQFDEVLTVMGLTKAVEKDSDGPVVTHLGFEFDSMNMEVRLPPNKKTRALRAVEHLMNASSVSFAALEEILGFLSHCCQVVPLGRTFLRQLFRLLDRKTNRLPSRRSRITPAVRKDLRWWMYFLTSWSSVSIIQLSRVTHDVATDASGVKGIGGVYRRRLFSERIPSRHSTKHINWKEMFAILHAFILWHKEWAGGHVRLACDNKVAVSAINKRSVYGNAILPLQTILLIAAVFNIDLSAFWVPSGENIVADSASRHDFKKLADLGFQVSSLRVRTPATRTSTLRQKLYSFLTSRSHLPQGEAMTLHARPTKRSAVTADIPLSQPPSKRSPTGSRPSCPKSNRPRQSLISSPCEASISNVVSAPRSLTTPASTWSLEVGRGATAKARRNSASLSRLQSYGESSQESVEMRTVSTSKQPSVWHLPPSFDLESLRGISGQSPLRHTL